MGVAKGAVRFLRKKECVANAYYLVQLPECFTRLLTDSINTLFLLNIFGILAKHKVL